jgi:hypothetical protein
MSVYSTSITIDPGYNFFRDIVRIPALSDKACSINKSLKNFHSTLSQLCFSLFIIEKPMRFGITNSGNRKHFMSFARHEDLNCHLLTQEAQL